MSGNEKMARLVTAIIAVLLVAFILYLTFHHLIPTLGGRA